MKGKVAWARRALSAAAALAVVAAVGLAPGVANAGQEVELETQASGISKTVVCSYLKGSPKNEVTITSPVKVEGVRSSNERVVAATPASFGYHVQVLLKGPGTATVSYSVNGVQNRVTYKVYKYENPVSKFRVGNKKHIAGKFAKGREFGLDFKESKYRKVVVEPADGWELVSIYGPWKSWSIENGGKAFTPGSIHAEFRNPRTGVEETVMVYDAGYYD